MFERIVRQLREYIFILSIILIIIGIPIFLMGVFKYFITGLQLGAYTDLIQNLGDWNAYILVIGLIILGTGVYYQYNYNKLKKFLLEELKTNKRSELQKKHSELKDAAKHLPYKYKKMLVDKEKEIRLK